MRDTFLKVMSWVFEEEGGYVDHPQDPFDYIATGE